MAGSGALDAKGIAQGAAQSGGGGVKPRWMDWQPSIANW